jgi:hypothetical protein
LTKVAKTIIVEDNRASLRKHIAELKTENSQLRDTTTESTKTISTLQRVVDNGIEDYCLLMEGNKSLLAEHNDFYYCCEDLKLAMVCSDAKKRTADLEVRVKASKLTSST